MSAKELKVVEHYLLTVDHLKNIERFDIGHSLRLSGDLKAAYEYDLKKIRNFNMKKIQK
jgi:hypothetical protein